MQIVDGALNTDSLKYSSDKEMSNKIKTECGSIHDEDRCEFAAKLQKCIQDILKTIPLARSLDL